MPRGPSDGYLAPYRDAVRQHGTAFESLLWRNPDFQLVRFQVLTSMLDVTGRVVADLGAGRADLLEWMHTHEVRYRRYVGVEAVPELHAYCVQRARDERLPEAFFEPADFVSDPGVFERLVREHGVEVMLFSGSLNTLEQDAAVAVLEAAWQAVEVVEGGGVVFNFLSDRAGSSQPGDPAHRFDASAVVAWALERTPRVALRTDHLGGLDAAVCLRAGV